MRDYFLSKKKYRLSIKARKIPPDNNPTQSNILSRAIVKKATAAPKEKAPSRDTSKASRKEILKGFCLRGTVFSLQRKAFSKE